MWFKVVVLLCFVFLLRTNHVETKSMILEMKKTPEWLRHGDSCISPNKINRKPVVLVPGILGSQIFARYISSLNSGKQKGTIKGDWSQLWISITEFFPYNIDTWAQAISMEYNREARTVHNKPWIETMVPHFGNTTAFETLDSTDSFYQGYYFSSLVYHLTCKLGYTRCEDLFGAPYDWRVAPHQQGEYFRKFKALIEEAYARNNNKKVVVLGHSMGNTYIYYFLMKQSKKWKDKYIDSFMSVSGAYLGSAKSMKVMIAGDTEGHDNVLSRLQMRSITRTFSSFLYMMPRPDLWPSQEPVVYTKNRNYTVYDYKELFQDSECDTCWEMWKENGMTLGDLKAPSVAVHCVYSSGIPTYKSLVFNGTETFPDGDPDFIMGDGDGTINKWSSSACLRWKKEQSQPVYDIAMPGNYHVDILNNATLYAYIDQFLIL